MWVAEWITVGYTLNVIFEQVDLAVFGATKKERLVVFIGSNGEERHGWYNIYRLWLELKWYLQKDRRRKRGREDLTANPFWDHNFKYS